MDSAELRGLLERCLSARASFFDPSHESAFRILNGFTEGLPELVIDLYASTAVITNYANPPGEADAYISTAVEFLHSAFPWLRACVLKVRYEASAVQRNGVLLFGDGPDEKVREHGLWYAVNPIVQRDAGLYLDTRNLRRWAFEHCAGQTVLNAFAYTGSLGIAALAGGARRAVQLDRNGSFFNAAKASCVLNGMAVREADFIKADFFRQAGAFRRQGRTFDGVFLDPPFFSASPSGTVDLVKESARLINKARPLVKDGGVLVAVNNAVYLSGKEYVRTLGLLCADGYMALEEIIPVPEDFTGYPGTRRGAPITDPAPFNHSTKIAVLRVKRKQGSDRQ